MISKLLYLTVVVKDQTKALDFYTNVLGFQKIADFSAEGGPRWLTVSPKGQDFQISLFQAGSYPQDTPQGRWKAGQDGPACTFLSDDCRKDFEYLKSRGVGFEAEPIEYPYGVGATFNDPDGNKFNLLTPGFSSGVRSTDETEEETADEEQKPVVSASAGSSSSSVAVVVQTFSEISGKWKKRNFLERQWVKSDFKKETGMSVEEMSKELSKMPDSSDGGVLSKDSAATLAKLNTYYEHLKTLIPQFEKTQERVKEGMSETQSGIDEIQAVLSGLVATQKAK